MTLKAAQEMMIATQMTRNHAQSKSAALPHRTAGWMPAAFWSSFALDTRSYNWVIQYTSSCQGNDVHCWTWVCQTDQFCAICIYCFPAIFTRSSHRLLEAYKNYVFWSVVATLRCQWPRISLFEEPWGNAFAAVDLFRLTRWRRWWWMLVMYVFNKG